jgi:type VI secretion system secreted protein VgrG
VLESVTHEAADYTQFPTKPGTPERPYYRNAFTCMPSTTLYVPPRRTPRPIMRGPQTAVVTGASGDEILTDQYGRVKVQFPWDRLGTNDDKSSCFIRVAQVLAGRGWGTLFTPRVGMEVVVDFLDGNPDRPLVTGCVYNGQNATPYTLPDNKTQSGFLSRSTTGGDTSTANELRFDDNKGSEMILFHAEKDFTREVENDDVLTVGNNQTITVTQNRSLTVSSGDDAVTISTGDQSTTVTKGNQTIDVGQGDQTTTIDQGNRTTSIKAGTDTLTVKGTLSTTVQSGDLSTTVSTGKHETKVSTGDHTTTVSTGNHTVTVSTGDSSLTTSVGQIKLSGTGGITLTCGSNSVKIDQSGVTINGMSVTIKGSMEVQIQGAMSTLKGDGMVTIKGGMVMIN